MAHKNVVRLYAAFEDEYNVYMVQEIATHGDLFQLVKNGDGKFSERRAIQGVMVPLLEALSYIHEKVGLRLFQLSSGRSSTASGATGEHCRFLAFCCSGYLITCFLLLYVIGHHPP